MTKNLQIEDYAFQLGRIIDPAWSHAINQGLRDVESQWEGWDRRTREEDGEAAVVLDLDGDQLMITYSDVYEHQGGIFGGHFWTVIMNIGDVYLRGYLRLFANGEVNWHVKMTGHDTWEVE